MVQAKDDFYTYVNEEWLQNNPCPDDYSRWGTFEELNKVILQFKSYLRERVHPKFTNKLISR